MLATACVNFGVNTVHLPLTLMLEARLTRLKSTPKRKLLQLKKSNIRCWNMNRRS